MGKTVSKVLGKVIGGDIIKGITGITAAEQADKAAKVAAAAASEQKAKIAKQEKLVEDERKRQGKVADERQGRLAQNQLLSGSETGTAKKKTTLLGAS